MPDIARELLTIAREMIGIARKMPGVARELPDAAREFGRYCAHYCVHHFGGLHSKPAMADKSPQLPWMKTLSTKDKKPR